MSELSPKFLAPFVTDKIGDKYIAQVPKIILEHLNSPEFTVDLFPEKRPGYQKLHFIRTQSTAADEDQSIEALVQKEFSTDKWARQVKERLARRGVLSSVREREEDNTIYSAFRADDKFTVKIDGLPEPFDKSDVVDLLHDCGCNYFEYINIPRDRETNENKPVAFVHFLHLRHAILFIENNPQIRIGRFILTPILVP
ncbi:hypothetical protein TVAG_337720 [Trichomonas vaginalis G3]|uniref:RRM domain-containing protein n=1 Tax=Trichomonas vaginalis (strain ATCC PRA-98 / G3) TaxID=412133 RepID=A2EWL8_TRIV3|nr:RNA-binding domain, RBD family-containing protein [Trichomonas vaginalis G3]EAY02972.1 hypothetical protein TVAG_337720 [Trichomonas vaginalis G3]KAI5492187.1 RNA-binding domain, RBD family-containing protein [Trichomonas vaginalis G3]|eukprot:XP_001315195.1 hypothetical protein [Trichomonas vaginalis G3]